MFWRMRAFDHSLHEVVVGVVVMLVFLVEGVKVEVEEEVGGGADKEDCGGE